MTDYLDYLSNVQKPSRYIGGEVNAVIKSDIGIRLDIALAFPDIYEIGMSHQGLKILYGLINQRPDFRAERVMAPWVDLEAHLRKNGLPLTAIESGRPLDDFDIVGFSLQYELSYTNILNMLELGRIPLLASERGDRAPLVIGGGPNAFNPEPVADFFDFFFLGDAETGFMNILDDVAEWKASGGRRADLLKHLAGKPGVYVPSFFRPVYENNGRIKEIQPLLPGYDHVERAVVPDLDSAFYPPRPVVPYCQPVHDRIAIEISRGCTRGCRFCQAGYIYRPVRERKPDTILDIGEKSLCSTGMNEASFLSLSAGDYSCLNELMSAFMDRHGPQHVALSLPSLRVKALTPEIMRQIKRVRKTGFTIAPEAGTQRLRDVINKDLTDDDLLYTAREAFKAGWQLIKLYFMVGLPTETDEDILAIASLARRIQSGVRGKVNVSFATFVPKVRTPFQWEAMIGLEEMRRRMALLRGSLRRPGLNPKWNEPESSLVEGILSRGDRRLGQVLRLVHERGGRFDAWGERLDLGLWLDALRECGLSTDDYLRARDLEEVLPWSHLHTGISDEYLKQEREKAMQAATTHDCRFGPCLACGACDFKTVKPVLSDPGKDAPAVETAEAVAGDVKKMQIRFSKTGLARMISHLETLDVFQRAFRRAGMAFRMSQGFHPQPRISFATPLAVGLTSLDEILTVELVNPPEPERILENLNRELPAWYRVSSVTVIPEGTPRLKFRGAVYRLEAPTGLFDENTLLASLERETLPVLKRGKRGMIEIDLKILLGDVRLLTGRTVELTLYHNDKGALRPDQAAAVLFGLEDAELAGIRVEKLKTLTEGT